MSPATKNSSASQQGMYGKDINPMMYNKDIRPNVNAQQFYDEINPSSRYSPDWESGYSMLMNEAISNPPSQNIANTASNQTIRQAIANVLSQRPRTMTITGSGSGTGYDRLIGQDTTGM